MSQSLIERETTELEKELLKTYAVEEVEIIIKLKNVVEAFPTIDGHFWVERDGRKIDPYFEEYESYSVELGSWLGLGLIQKSDRKRWIYNAADSMTQQIMISIFTKGIEKEFATPSEYINQFISFAGDEPRYQSCYKNSLIEIEKNGGTLVFESYGIELKDGSKIYLFGGEDYKNVKSFIK